MSENGSPPLHRLPGAERAFVEPAKITDYLLNMDHTHGGDKAAYLMRFGFRRDSWQILLVALLAHARAGYIVGEQRKAYGRHFAVEGPLVTPDRRNPIVRTVWMVRSGDDRPRFLTAYPAKRRHGERTT